MYESRPTIATQTTCPVRMVIRCLRVLRLRLYTSQFHQQKMIEEGNFLRKKSILKGFEYVRSGLLRLAFRQLLQSVTFDLHRSPTIIQTQSINKQLESSIQITEELEPKKGKQLTFLQQKVRSSTSPQQEIFKQDETDLICEEQDSEVIQHDADIKVKKKQSRISLKTFETKEYSRQAQKRRVIEHQDMRFGDVFVIKASVESFSKSLATSVQVEATELIVIGDQDFHGSINCVAQNNQAINSAYAHQQKCFFTVVNPRTASETDAYVCYGQRILLKHVQTGQCLQMNLDMPAQERGASEVVLTSLQNHQSILRIMPSSSSKKVGDRVQYNDTLLFQQDSTRQHYLRLEREESRYGGNRFVDINAGDQGDQFHLHKVASTNYRVVQIVHQESQNVLQSSEKQLQQFIQNKTCMIQNPDSNEDQHQDTFSLRWFDLQRFLNQEFEVLVQPVYTSYSYFEVQPISPFVDHQPIEFACRLKQICTQQYLAVDPNDEKRVRLTANIGTDHTVFKLIPEPGMEGVITLQSSAGSFLGIAQNGKLIFSQLGEDQQPQLFELRDGEKGSVEFVQVVNELEHRVLNFYAFLQGWSIISDKRKQNEEILTLDYLKSLQQKQQLDIEVSRFALQLERLRQQLTPTIHSLDQFTEQTAEIGSNEKQKLIREQKLLDLLFMVLRLIDNIVYTSQKVQRDKDKRLFKSARLLPQVRSSSYLAYKALGPLPPIIYKILLLTIKNNILNRKIALDNDEFLCQQLKNYGPQVGAILREAIIDATTVDMSDYVKLLEPVDEETNLYEMTTFVKIIALAMVDSSNQGIRRHQNKVCKELFSQEGKNGKTKFLCQFSLVADKPTFILYREVPIGEFLMHNKSLTNLIMIRQGNEDYFYIEQLCDKSNQIKTLCLYMNYLAASITLLAQMCRGRNKKCIKKVQFTGITAHHIFAVIKSPSVPLKLKNCYLSLYEVLFIDIDPFLPLNIQGNFRWDQKQGNQKLSETFNHYVESDELAKLTSEFDKVLPMIIDLLNYGCREMELLNLQEAQGCDEASNKESAIRSENITEFNKTGNIDHGNAKLGNAIQTRKRQGNRKEGDNPRHPNSLEPIIRDANGRGGEAREEKNKKIAASERDGLGARDRTELNSAEALMLKEGDNIKEDGNQGNDRFASEKYARVKREGSMSREDAAARQRSNNRSGTNIHQVTVHLKSNLSNAKIKSTSQKIKFYTTLVGLLKKLISLGYLTPQQICIVIKSILQIFVPFLTIQERSLLDIHEKHWLPDLISENLRSVGQWECLDKLFAVAGHCLQEFFKQQLNVQIYEFMHHFKSSYKNYCLQSLPKLAEEVTEIFQVMKISNQQNYVQNTLLGFYCSNWPANSRGFKECWAALQMGTKQNYIQYLRKVEIIQEHDADLYMLLTGNTLGGSIFSPVRLEIQISQLEDEFQKRKDEGKQKEEKTQEIDNQLNKLINRIKEMKNDPIKRRKTQNILRNLYVDKQILRIFRLKDIDKLQKLKTPQIAIKFLSLFVFQNPINADEIKDDAIMLLKLNNLKVAKFVALLVHSLDKVHVQKIKEIYKVAFQVMNENRNCCIQMYGFLLSLMSCKNLIEKQDKTYNLKREILSNLFKLPYFLNDLQYYKQFIEIKSKKDEQNFYQGDFKYFQACLSLTAKVVQDYPIGIQQIQQVLVNEQILQILSNPATSFIFRAEALKILYSTQIQNFPNFSMMEMRDLLLLLLGDLLQFPKYLDGILLPFSFINEEQYQMIANDRIAVDRLKLSLLSELEEKKKNLIAQTPGQVISQSAVQSQTTQLNDAKRIVADNTEYWKYLYYESQWKRCEFGVLVTLQQLFLEISKRGWSVQESAQQNQQMFSGEQFTQNNEDSLYEPIVLLKQAVENLRLFILLLDQNLTFPKHKRYVLSLQHAIVTCLLNCPLPQQVQSLRVNKFSQEVKILAAMRSQLKDSVRVRSADGSRQSDGDVQNVIPQLMNGFYKQLKQYMLAKHLTLYKMMDQIKGKWRYRMDRLQQDGVFVVDNLERREKEQFMFEPEGERRREKVILQRDEFCKLFASMYEEHYRIQKEMGQSQPHFVTYDDALKYFENFLIVKDHQLQQKLLESQNQKREYSSKRASFDLNKFYAYFINYLESTKFNFDKKQLKKEQQTNAFSKSPREESQVIKDTYIKFLYQYELLLCPSNSYNFYQLNKLSLGLLAQQFAIRIANQENCTLIFGKILREERNLKEGLALDLLHQLVQTNLHDQDKLVAFLFGQVPNILEYLSIELNEYLQYKKIVLVMKVMLSLQEIDINRFVSIFLSKASSFARFLSQIFNQTDRYLSYDASSKQDKTECPQTQLFYSRSEMLKEKNLKLECLLQIVKLVLTSLSSLFINSQIKEFYSQFNQSCIILEDILNFTSSYHQYINRNQLTHINTECDTLITFTKCLAALTSFCEGNKLHHEIILNHKPLIPVIQHIITVPKFDLLADNLQDNEYRNLFKATVQFLLQIKMDSDSLYSELHFQWIFDKLIKIFDHQNDRLNALILGQKCTHTDNINCTFLSCQFGMVTVGEQELFKICFDILILFNILSEGLSRREGNTLKLEQDEGMKRNVNFVKTYHHLRNYVLSQPYTSSRKSILYELLLNEENMPQVEILERQAPVAIRRKSQQYTLGPRTYIKIGGRSDASPKGKFKESIHKITHKKHQVAQHLDDQIPFQKLEEVPEPDEVVALPKRKLGSKKVAEVVMNLYENAQISKQQDLKKQELCLKIADAIFFFSKYIGEIEVQHGGQLQHIYFVLPFKTSFVHRSAKNLAKRIKIYDSKFHQLQAMANFYNEEVQFRQKLAIKPLISDILLRIDIVKQVNYFLIVLLNAIYLGTLSGDSQSGFNTQDGAIYLVSLILNLVIVIISAIVMAIEIINIQPYLRFKIKFNKARISDQLNLGFKDTESKKRSKRKIRLRQYLNQNILYVQFSNPKFLYYTSFLIITSVSMVYQPLIAVLLFDFIQHCKNLQNVMTNITSNVLSILQIIIITFIIIYCYSVLAFVAVDHIYIPNNGSRLFDIFIGFLVNGLQINPILSEEIVEDEKRWGPQAFTITFFILIFVVYVSLIIGLISGQYGKASEKERQYRRKCQICELTFEQCRELKQSWKDHTRKRHHLEKYLFFIISIMQKKPQECTYLEREIQDKTARQDMSWLPSK